MSKLTNIDDDCTRCGICCEAQRTDGGMPEKMFGDLAAELIAVEDISELSYEAYDFLLSCSLCGACTVSCPQEISAVDAVKLGRERLVELLPSYVDAYRPFRVDYKENLFTLLRAAAGFSYEDVLDGAQSIQSAQDAQESQSIQGAQSIFFAGCSMSSYSEALTKATFELLKSLGLADGMTVYCCGKPLSDIGLSAEYESYGTGLIKALRARAVKHIVAACPNCYYSLKALFGKQGVGDIELEALPQVLKQQGIACTQGKFQRISVHDSCPDRSDKLFAEATRALLAEEDKVALLEMKSHGEDTICCGAGGLSQVGGYEHSMERCANRLGEFADTGAECLVCSCVSCVNAFLAHEKAPAVRHYLELLLKTEIDWNAVAIAYDELYGKSDNLLTLPLEESTPVFGS